MTTSRTQGRPRSSAAWPSGPGSAEASGFAACVAHVADLTDEHVEVTALVGCASPSRRTADQREHAAREIALSCFQRPPVERLDLAFCEHRCILLATDIPHGACAADPRAVSRRGLGSALSGFR